MESVLTTGKSTDDINNKLFFSSALGLLIVDISVYFKEILYSNFWVKSANFELRSNVSHTKGF